ncbi:DUF1266 domain-containing protein [Saccharibacillus kuerlensis]|uniref:DUF1266 domain-containing protein n=1 Tax=Saccharibacillus kuerlensis TaxID=459527 RepID=A0ABQ2L800_9BACL|nr:DUF1266 domain-containing protein [Saccharibacillus kuerlensis]GGO06285.1 hypothetical protein GCM10010969_33540 [Saccharibacillus kuerlensis]
MEKLRIRETDKRSMRAFAMGAVLFRMNGLLEETGFAWPASRREELRKLLAHTWSVKDEESLEKHLNWLWEEGSQASYRKTESFISALSFRDREHYFDRLNSNAALFNHARLVQMYSGKLSRAGIAAWDLGQYVFICRTAQSAGWLEAERSIELAAAAARKAQELYKNWPEFAAAYLAGRQIWNNQPSAEAAKPYIDCVSTLLTDSRSLWRRLPWDMSLEKDTIEEETENPLHSDLNSKA